MGVIGYRYEGDVHCNDCTEKTFGETFIKMRGLSDHFLPDDREGNRIISIFSIDDRSYLGPAWTQLDQTTTVSFNVGDTLGFKTYLFCGDCPEIIAEYRYTCI